METTPLDSPAPSAAALSAAAPSAVRSEISPGLLAATWAGTAVCFAAVVAYIGLFAYMVQTDGGEGGWGWLAVVFAAPPAMFATVCGAVGVSGLRAAGKGQQASKRCATAIVGGVVLLIGALALFAS